MLKSRLSLLAATAMLALVGVVAVAQASPPSGVTPPCSHAAPTTPSRSARVTMGPSTSRPGQVPLDIVVRQHDYAVGSTTGWHSHPGLVFITVTQGELTYYERDDPDCTPHIVSRGQGFVDDGHGHIVRNESGQTRRTSA